MLNDSIEETDIESKARNLLKEEEEKTEKQEIPKRKNRYEVEVNDTELQTLSTTLDLLNSRDIINYNLDNLKMKIDHFSINKKEEFLKLLKDEFSQSIKGYNNSIDHFYLQVQSMKLLSDSDLSKVNSLYTGIQKIEEKNHRIELRNQNKKKLQEYMKNLLDQLTITPQRKEVLLHTEYISTSELVIVNEVLKNFVEFYKNRKKQDIDMAIELMKDYKGAHQILLDLYIGLKDKGLPVSYELNQRLSVLHSYMIAKKMIKLKLAMKAARNLLRVANSITMFEEDKVKIMTTVAIECQEAGLYRSSSQWAIELMKEYKFK